MAYISNGTVPKKNAELQTPAHRKWDRNTSRVQRKKRTREAKEKEEEKIACFFLRVSVRIDADGYIGKHKYTARVHVVYKL